MGSYAQALQHKQDVGDEERRGKAEPLLANTKNLQAEISSYKDSDGNVIPQYQAQHDKAVDALTKTQQAWDELYHPVKAPGAAAQDIHWIIDKFKSITVPKDKTPSSVTSQAPEVTVNTPAALTQSLDLPAAQQTTPALPSKGGNATTTLPGAEAVTMPTMGGSVTLPAPPPVTVTKAPAPASLSWGQAQLLKRQAASMQKAQQEAALLASGAPLSPQQQAMSQVRTDNIIKEAQIDESLKIAEKLGITGSALDEMKQQLAGLKNVTFKPLTGAAGAPTLAADGRYYQAGSDANGNVVSRPMPVGWKPNTKAVRGTLINTKSNGWVQTWVDPYNPSKVIGFQKVTPGSRYTGSTSSSTSTDPFGLTTSSSRSTTPTSGSTPVDVDLSGMQELPESFNGEDIPENPAPARQTPVATPPPSGSPNRSPVPTPKPPPSVAKPVTGGVTPQPKTGATPAQLKSQIPAPPQASGAPLTLDATGHIPSTVHANPQLIEAANQLLDGMDIEKLTIPQKAREAASALARQYGWGGQGMFAPQQKLQIKEASTFLNDALKSPALSALDSWESRQKLIAVINNAEGHPGYIDAFLARNTNLDPKEAEFLRMFRQLTGTISGLASLTRPGRPTEAGIKRLMAELPNPNESHSADDGRKRLKRLIKEIDIATQKGNADNIFDGDSSSTKQQYKVGDWVMYKGQKKQVKSIDPDGTLEL
jgi:hypothetical protein